jgi:hypothetical protein
MAHVTGRKFASDIMAAPAAEADLAVLREQQKARPNVVFVIERSKNKNIVVYEVLVKEGAIDASASALRRCFRRASDMRGAPQASRWTCTGWTSTPSTSRRRARAAR